VSDVDVVEWEESPMSELTLSHLQQEAYRVAVARGQWPRGCRATAAVPSVLATVARRALGEEVTELGAALSRLGPAGSLDPVSDELADVVIVCASIAEALGVDLERAVLAKMRRNEERAQEHARANRHSEEGGDDRLTPERLAELRRIAEAATPGPWRIRTDPRYDDADRFVIASADRDHIVETTQGGSWTDEDLANARYISTFDPPTVRALLDEIDRLRRWREEMAEVLKAVHDRDRHIHTCDHCESAVCPQGAEFSYRAYRALAGAFDLLAREEIADSETRFVLYDPDLNAWECQACRFWWEFEDGDPYEHDMRFCPRCGRRIVREAQHLAGAPDQA